MEMLHVMLKYPKVVTNLDFIKVSTFLLDIRVGIIVYYCTETEYFVYVIAEVGGFWRFIYPDKYRLHTQNQPLLLYYLRLSKISVDKITQCDIRPLRQIFNKPGEYYRCFVVSSKVKIVDFHDKIKSNLSYSL